MHFQFFRIVTRILWFDSVNLSMDTTVTQVKFKESNTSFSVLLSLAISEI